MKAPKINQRILIVDDNTAIHEDFRKILCPGGVIKPGLNEMEAALFGDPVAVDEQVTF